MMECERCGLKFTRKSHLERHLKRVTPCEATKSLAGPKILLEKLEKSSRKKFVCPGCSRTYDYSSNLNRHKRDCKSIILLTQVLKNQEALAREFQEMKMQMAPAAGGQAASAVAGSQQYNFIGGLGTVNNTTVNAPTYNIRAWDPQNIDVGALDGAREETQNNLINHAFLHKYQAETLMASYMDVDPPTNYIFYAPTKRIEDVRVFDGTAFRKLENPTEVLEASRLAFHEIIMFRARTDESALRYTCDYYDKDFETHKEYLESTAKKPLEGSSERMLDKLHRVSPNVKKVIDAERINVD